MNGKLKSHVLWFNVSLILLLANLMLAATLAFGQTNLSAPLPESNDFLNKLTEYEREWLRNHPIIRVVQDPGWPPVEFTDESMAPLGMSADYLDIIEKRLGVKFERVRGLSWQEAYTRLKRWDIDMTTSVAVTPERTKFWAFTKPYMKIPIIIATQPNVTYIGDMQELNGKKVAVVDGYAVNDWIAREFPEVRQIRVKTALDGLESLQRGEVFAYIDNLLVVGYYQAKMQVTGIKIAGQTPYINAQAMAVRKDWEPLAGILQKALDSISLTERNDIYRKWLPIRYEYGYNYALFWKAFFIFVVILLALVIWNWRLAKEIKSRKAAEEALRVSEEQYRLLTESIKDVVWTLDIDTMCFQYVSPSVERLRGYTPEEIIAQPITHALTKENAEYVKNTLNDRTESFLSGKEAPGKFYTEELEQPCRDGSTVWTEIITNFYINPRNQRVEVRGVTRDISDRKRAQDEIKKLNMELEQRVAQRTLQLETTNKELEAFCYSVSHDLRAPLRAIDGFSKAIMEDCGELLDEHGQDYLQRVRAAAGKMSSLIDDLLKLSRLSRDTMKYQDVNLSDLVTGIASSLQQTDPERSVDFVIEADAVVQGDERLLAVMLENLLDNAWKFTKYQPKAVIEFGVCMPNGEPTYFVRDNGVGFDMTYVDKLFGAFQRLHGVDEFPGTGIGLATVQRIISRHGGRIWAESQLGKGAVFYFVLQSDRAAETLDPV